MTQTKPDARNLFERLPHSQRLPLGAAGAWTKQGNTSASPNGLSTGFPSLTLCPWYDFLSGLSAADSAESLAGQSQLPHFPPRPPFAHGLLTRGASGQMAALLRPELASSPGSLSTLVSLSHSHLRPFLRTGFSPAGPKRPPVISLLKITPTPECSFRGAKSIA